MCRPQSLSLIHPMGPCLPRLRPLPSLPWLPTPTAVLLMSSSCRAPACWETSNLCHIRCQSATCLPALTHSLPWPPTTVAAKRPIHSRSPSSHLGRLTSALPSCSRPHRSSSVTQRLLG